MRGEATPISCMSFTESKAYHIISFIIESEPCVIYNVCVYCLVYSCIELNEDVDVSYCRIYIRF